MIFTNTYSYASLAPLDFETRDRQLAEVDKLYRKQDVKGLLALLQKYHLIIKKDVALKLGRLGVKEAINDIQKYDKQFSRFNCLESGEFKVAIILIENRHKDSQKKSLLKIATEPLNKEKYAYSVIDAAGRELHRYKGNDIIKALTNINTYGAQFTVLFLRCESISKINAIEKCISVLEAYETPQKAEAAQDILISYGKDAEVQTKNLKMMAEKRIKINNSVSSIQKTIINRCNWILKRINKKYK